MFFSLLFLVSPISASRCFISTFRLNLIRTRTLIYFSAFVSLHQAIYIVLVINSYLLCSLSLLSSPLFPAIFPSTNTAYIFSTPFLTPFASVPTSSYTDPFFSVFLSPLFPVSPFSTSLSSFLHLYLYCAYFFHTLFQHQATQIHTSLYCTFTVFRFSILYLSSLLFPPPTGYTFPYTFSYCLRCRVSTASCLSICFSPLNSFPLVLPSYFLQLYTEHAFSTHTVSHCFCS